MHHTSLNLRQRRFLGGSAVRVHRALHLVVAGTLLATTAVCAVAADAPTAAARSEPQGLSTELIKPGLYRINGAGGGTLLRLGPAGVVVVDSRPAGSYRALMAEVQRVAKAAELPVRALVLTAAGAEQAGNVAQFVEAGVPVVVHQQALARVTAAAPGLSTAGAGRLITYGTDYTLQAAGVSTEIEFVGRGRTGADSIVYFPELRTVAVGDLFTHGTPVADCASGGSLAGWAAAIDHFLYFSFDVAVPSRGAPVGKPELAALKEKLLEMAERASASPSGSAGCRPPG